MFPSEIHARLSFILFRMDRELKHELKVSTLLPPMNKAWASRSANRDTGRIGWYIYIVRLTYLYRTCGLGSVSLNEPFNLRHYLNTDKYVKIYCHSYRRIACTQEGRTSTSYGENKSAVGPSESRKLFIIACASLYVPVAYKCTLRLLQCFFWAGTASLASTRYFAVN